MGVDVIFFLHFVPMQLGCLNEILVNTFFPFECYVRLRFFPSLIWIDWFDEKSCISSPFHWKWMFKVTGFSPMICKWSRAVSWLLLNLMTEKSASVFIQIEMLILFGNDRIDLSSVLVSRSPFGYGSAKSFWNIFQLLHNAQLSINSTMRNKIPAWSGNVNRNERQSRRRFDSFLLKTGCLLVFHSFAP